MKNRIVIIILWLMSTECMDLHYDYYVSDNFCGIANNIIQPNAGLNPSPMLIAIKIAFHIFPLLYIIGVILSDMRITRTLNFGIAALYTAFHAAHFTSQLSQSPFNLNQVLLLLVALLISALLVMFSRNWMQELDRPVKTE